MKADQLGGYVVLPQRIERHTPEAQSTAGTS
jgi:hypothetical protein